MSIGAFVLLPAASRPGTKAMLARERKRWGGFRLALQRGYLRYAKTHRAKIARHLTDPKVFAPEVDPVSVFMAGSPGAGKTEASIELLNQGARRHKSTPYRSRRTARDLARLYGQNAWLFQRAVIPIIEFMHDLALKKSFLLDGTLSSYKVAEKHIQRSLKRGRTVQILFVYQEPQQAWQFV